MWHLRVQIMRHEHRIKPILILAVCEADVWRNDCLLIAVEIQIVFIYLYLVHYHWCLRHDKVVVLVHAGLLLLENLLAHGGRTHPVWLLVAVLLGLVLDYLIVMVL